MFSNSTGKARRGRRCLLDFAIYPFTEAIAHSTLPLAGAVIPTLVVVERAQTHFIGAPVLVPEVPPVERSVFYEVHSFSEVMEEVQSPENVVLWEGVPTRVPVSYLAGLRIDFLERDGDTSVVVVLLFPFF
jgi:hypothetical protein